MLLRVREFRKRAGLRQLDLATRSQCSRELISAIENCRHSPNTDLLGRIALALRVPLWSLFENDTPPEPPPGGLPTLTPMTWMAIALPINDIMLRFCLQ